MRQDEQPWSRKAVAQLHVEVNARLQARENPRTLLRRRFRKALVVDSLDAEATLALAGLLNLWGALESAATQHTTAISTLAAAASLVRSEARAAIDYNLGVAHLATGFEYGEAAVSLDFAAMGESAQGANIEQWATGLLGPRTYSVHNTDITTEQRVHALAALQRARAHAVGRPADGPADGHLVLYQLVLTQQLLAQAFEELPRASQRSLLESLATLPRSAEALPRDLAMAIERLHALRAEIDQMSWFERLRNKRPKLESPITGRIAGVYATQVDVPSASIHYRAFSFVAVRA